MTSLVPVEIAGVAISLAGFVGGLLASGLGFLRVVRGHRTSPTPQRLAAGGLWIAAIWTTIDAGAALCFRQGCEPKACLFAVSLAAVWLWQARTGWRSPPSA